MPLNYPYQQEPKKSNRTVIGLVIVSVLLVGALGFAVWAYMGLADYQKNTDQKIAEASIVIEQKISTKKDQEYTEKEKSPYKTYKGPATYGSISIQYPKTWSAFVNESSGTPAIDGYFHPNFVPGLLSKTDFALRVVVVNTPYDNVIKTFDSAVKTGKVKVSAYRAPKVPSVLGSRVDGEINIGQKDSMVVFAVRDKTIKIYTESQNFLNDFNTIILANLTFSP